MERREDFERFLVVVFFIFFIVGLFWYVMFDYVFEWGLVWGFFRVF